MENLSKKAAKNLSAIKEKKPLIHNITNYVVMNFTANVLLAAGASPVMAHAENEVEEMVSLASALVLNIGTLTDDRIASMIKAGKKASELGKPVILDPVGAGATLLRTHSAKKIIQEVRLSVIRGNASEILSLSNSSAKTRGVDAVHSVEETVETARILAREFNTVIAITGVKDLITDGERVIWGLNGHPLMACITGTGCAATAIIGAFLAVDEDAFSAAATALAYFGLAGEKAAKSASAPGSFMTALLDALYTLMPGAIEAGCRFIK